MNGNLHSSNFDHEDKSKIKINSYDKTIDYKISKNSLVCLNHALAEDGYSLEDEKNYRQYNQSLIKQPLKEYKASTLDWLCGQARI